MIQQGGKNKHLDPSFKAQGPKWSLCFEKLFLKIPWIILILAHGPYRPLGFTKLFPKSPEFPESFPPVWAPIRKNVFPWKQSSLPAVFYSINENFCLHCPFIQAYPFVREVRVRVKELKTSVGSLLNQIAS